MYAQDSEQESRYDKIKQKVGERIKNKSKGYLLLEHTKYSILPAEQFGRWAYKTGNDAIGIYQTSGAAEALSSKETAFATILGAGFLASLDSYRRSLDLKENYQKGALERILKEEFDTQLEEKELDELYSRLIEE